MKRPDGRLAATTIPRRMLPFRLPGIDTGAAKPRTHSTLYVVAHEWQVSGQESPIGVACVVPSDYGARSLAAELNKLREIPAGLAAALARPDTVLNGVVPEVLGAAAVLRLVVRGRSAGAPHAQVRQPAGFMTNSHSVANLSSPCYSGICPTVFITATSGTQWVIDPTSVWWYLGNVPSYGGGFYTDFSDTYCADASARYLDMLPGLDSLIADSTSYATLRASYDSFVCVPRSDGKTKCLDLWIAKKTAFIFKGDNREIDPDADYSASRVQMYVDFDGNSAVAYVSHTTMALWGNVTDTITYPHSPKAFQLHVIDDSTKAITWEFFQGFCTYAQMFVGDVCPAIDGQAIFRRVSPGNWQPIDVRRDNFPWLAIFRQDPDGSFIKEAYYPGEWPMDLITRGRTIQEWRKQMSMPRGCNLQ